MNECKIVEDLIPLYAEDLTNEATSEFVRQHVEHCEACNKLLQRCHETVPTAEADAKAYKKTMRKNMVNMTCRIVVVALLIFVVMLVGGTKLGEYMDWKNGKAPVEQVIKAPVGQGEVTLVDWDASGWKIGGAENVGTVIWTRQVHVRQDEHGTGYNMSEGANTEPWENVQVYWTPDGLSYLMTADLLKGGKGIFIHAYSHHYDEKGKHFSESKLLPTTAGNGFVDVLTTLCKENENIPTGWDTIDFNFYQWLSDSETITFVYETDNGHRGLLDFHYPTETITAVN